MRFAPLETRLLVSWTSILAAAVLWAPSMGCNRKHPCAVLYEKFKKCTENFPMAERDFVSMCDEQRHKHVEVVENQIKCAKDSSSCADFKKCVGDVRKKAMVREATQVLDKAIAAKDWGRALAQCDALGSNLTPELKKRCTDAARQGYETTRSALLKLRDQGAPPTAPNVSAMCILLRSASQWTGHRNDADALCGVEIKHAKAVADTLAQASQAAKSASPALPPACVTLPKVLAKARFQSSWVKAKRRALLQTCFVKLGRAILEKKLATRPKACDPEVRKVLDGLVSENLVTDELKPLVDKASKVCPLPKGRATKGAQARPAPRPRTPAPRPRAGQAR